MTKHLQLADCPIFLGPLAENLTRWLEQYNYSRTFLIADANTRKHCRPLLPAFEAVEYIAGPETEGTVLHGLEPYKTLDSCEAVWKAMFDAGLDRGALVINLGGGVIGDMGGFCAATYKRGVDFIQIPTSLLAMTDAAIGGKVGVDFRGIKNAVGVFNDPVAVFIDPSFLKTLPARQLRSGFAEMIKHALIGDPALWQRIRELPLENLAGYEALPASLWIELMQASIKVKTHLVAKDPREAGIRALLNFGHTFGHALESYFLQTGKPLSHGEAVAIGMICESWLETLEEGKTMEIARTILRLFGHRTIPERAFPILWDLMEKDKKNTSGAVRMAVPDAESFSIRWLGLSPEESYRRLRAYNGLKKSLLV